MVSGYHIGQCVYRTFPSWYKVLLGSAALGPYFFFSFLFTHLSATSLLVTSADELWGQREKEMSILLLN